MQRVLARYSWLIGSLAAATLLDGCRCNDEPAPFETGTSSESSGTETTVTPVDLPSPETETGVVVDMETDTMPEDTMEDTTDTGPGTGCDDDVIEAGEVCFERLNLITAQSS